MNIKSLRKKLSKFKTKCKPNCYACCGQIQMSEEELAAAKKLCPSPPRGKGAEYCEYLDKRGACVVYNERPIICRAFGSVDTPFLKCKDCKGQLPSKQLERELYDYGIECNRDGVPNECAREDDIITKVREGDLASIKKVLQALSQMYLDKTITEKEFMEKIELYERFYKEKTGKDLMKEIL